MNNTLIVSSSPHFHAKDSTQRIMLDVLISLAPATVAAVVLFGLKAVWILLACTLSCVLSEYLFNLIVKKPQTVGDLSAAVTGVLLALNVGTNTPVWQCVIGGVFSIVVVKCLFGGLGCNFANPAITGRIFMMLSFSAVSGASLPVIVDGVSTATPLAVMKTGEGTLPPFRDLLLGLHGGAIGETCAVALLLGFVYLVVRKVIHWQIPVIFVGTVFVLSWLIGGDVEQALYAILSGGLLLGAIFMATDYVTSPITVTGKMIFAFGCGLITVLIRFFGVYPEGVSFSILLMNILSPYIEEWTKRKPLGGNKA